MIGNIVAAAVVWTIIGAILCIIWIANKYANGWELCNPYWIYQYHKSVNWFGAIILALVFNLLCPPISIGYWFYKLCTVGRKDEE